MKELFMRRPVLALAGAIAAAVVLTGCGSVDTAPNMTGVDISNGSFSAATFEGCYGPSTLKYKWASDTQAYFPEGTRTLVFGDGAHADFPPLTVTTNDGPTLPINAVVSFHVNTSCAPYTDAQGVHWPNGILQKFYTNVALQYHAFSDAGDQEPGEGWDKMLAARIAAPVERAISNQALNFSSAQLNTDPVSKGTWERDTTKEIAATLKQLNGEDYLIIDGVLIQKPVMPTTIQQELLNKQAAVLRGQTADIDKNTAANFPGGFPQYMAYLGQTAINKAIAEGKAQIVVNPTGGPVLIGQR
jgi:hypothetical protein